jgi:hypothetical protein
MRIRDFNSSLSRFLHPVSVSAVSVSSRTQWHRAQDVQACCSASH